MRWLHLSDLHVGRDSSAQRTALASLVSAIDEYAKDANFDMVLLTGDLAYSGHPDEYRRLQQLLLDPLRALRPFLHARVVAVPGNHDLDCNVGVPISWDRLGAPRQQEFFAASETGRRLRQHRADGFTEYEAFAERCDIATCIPTHSPASGLSVQDRAGSKIELVCVNTAYFSDKDVDDKNVAPSPVDAVRDVFSDLSTSNPIFVIGHHPIHWFLRDSANHFKTLLIQKNAVYLHGHLHEIDPIFGQKGLVSLGFGAAYQAPLSAPAKPYYRNTFAMCELDDLLRVRFISWDADYGSWVPETHLPADIQMGRDHDLGTCSIRLPTSSIEMTASGSLKHQLLAGIAVKPRLNSPIWIDSEPKAGWVNLLRQLGEIKGVDRVTTIGPQDANGGSIQLVVHDATGRHLVRAFSASSSTITYSQIEQTNTLLDTESLGSCILATFGSLSQEAATLAARLKDKKALSVLTGADLAARASSFPIVEQIRIKKIFDFERVTFTPMIVRDGVAVLVTDAAASAWFCVIAADGSLLDESAELTYQTRKAVPELRETPYWSTQSCGTGIAPSDLPFDRGTYLTRSASLFDTVRYAGLAALGFRLPVDSLRKLYVPAAADVATNQASHQALKTAVDDFVEALKLDTAQRDQLEMQLRNYYGLSKSAEAGAASALYQKYGAILVVGDPGSGKSCFVRSEILAYCQPPATDRDWYAKHTPVFVPLADAARTAERGEDLLDICVRLAASQRLEFTRRHLDILIARGEVAFFFDGVDEVGSLEIRQMLLRQISELMDAHQRQGNRFVVTSRPAAIHSAEVPDELTRIRLRGLTNHEIEILATRIMSIEATSGEMLAELHGDEREVVEQLVRDCEEKPGIRRLARNPLLLTLLVLIYANSGPLAARRHIVYSQAVKTLVSVRHRSSKSKVLSEADLRGRLGKLAISIYRGVVSEIPSRKEVREALRDGFGSSEQSEVDTFVQEVAETTGLVVIHPRSDSQEDDVISFMHHSFLEYYAAVGFMKEPDYAERAPLVALSPRWREVVTLMFGLLGEQGDISDFLSEIAKERDPADRITGSRFSMALDCALECDVPPHRAQDLIGELLQRMLSEGAGGVVADARSSLSSRIQELLQNTGSETIRRRLTAGSQSEDPRISAAHIDFIARMPYVLNEDANFRSAISVAFTRKNAPVRIACISALQSARALRTDENLSQVRVSLKRGSVPEQYAALQFLDSEPALIPDFSTNVLECLNSKHRLISDLAARCVIVGGTFAQSGYQNRGLLDKALRIYTQADGPQKRLDKYIELSSDKLESLIFSDSPDDQKLGIRSLVAIQREPAAVHGYLFSVLRMSENHEVRTACLEAMAVDARMIRVASLADTDLVCKCATDDHVDVRKSAARALRHFPTIDFVRDTLRDRYEALRTAGDESERAEIIKSLATHGVQERDVRGFLQDELIRSLERASDGWGKRRKSLISRLLHACEHIGASLSSKGSALLYEVATDFRTPADIRRLAIRVFGRTCAPTVENGDRILSLLDRPQRPERLSAYKAAGAFSDKCRGNVSTVRLVHSTLERLEATLIAKWDSESKGLRDRIDFVGLRDIRTSLLSIEEILTSYNEFSSRMKVSEFERQGSFELE